MRKRLACPLLLCLAFLLFYAAAANAEGSRRALLIGCDHFVSQADTAPAASMNVTRMARMLQSDARGYVNVVGKSNGLTGAQALLDTIAAAFAGAQEGDVSVLYICTHGLYDRVQREASLLLSDGDWEEAVAGWRLREALDAVPGTKVLLIDACNSGAFIGKGEWTLALRSSFTGPDYKVLTSAGASEDSFLWHAANQRGGGSYFAAELCEGFEGRAFDLNGDGAVTLSETYAGLLESHGASTPQCYPQEDDFVLYAYDVNEPYAGERVICDVVLEESAISLRDSRLFFSFTVRRQARVQYQIVYYRGGRWRFDDAQIIPDADDVLAPGRKERQVTLSVDDGEATGYVLLQIVASENDRAMVAASRLISVQPDAGDPRLRVWAASVFEPAGGAEMAVNVRHDFPCALTVTVRDAQGALVRRLCYKRQSRPLGLSAEGSVFYWNGKTNAGEQAPAGEYYFEVTCAVGGVAYTERSAAFSLLL